MITQTTKELNAAKEYGDLLTVEDLTELLKVNGDTVRSLCRAGKLPAIHIGRKWYVPRKRLEAMYEGEECK